MEDNQTINDLKVKISEISTKVNTFEKTFATINERLSNKQLIIDDLFLHLSKTDLCVALLFNDKEQGAKLYGVFLNKDELRQHIVEEDHYYYNTKHDFWFFETMNEETGEVIKTEFLVAHFKPITIVSTQKVSDTL